MSPTLNTGWFPSPALEATRAYTFPLQWKSRGENSGDLLTSSPIVGCRWRIRRRRAKDFGVVDVFRRGNGSPGTRVSGSRHRHHRTLGRDRCRWRRLRGPTWSARTGSAETSPPQGVRVHLQGAQTRRRRQRFRSLLTQLKNRTFAVGDN